jgi:ent-kaurene oxidase
LFPTLQAIPGAPILGNLHQLKEKKPFKTFFEWTDKYGPIFTVKLGSKTMVVINSSEIAKEVRSTEIEPTAAQYTCAEFSFCSLFL